MKKILTLLLCFSLVGLYSCSKDDDNDGGDGGNTGVMVNVLARYEKADTGSEGFNDSGAKVYLFFDFDCKNPNGFVYQKGGKYVKGDVIYSADQTATTGNDGKASINAKYTNRPLTVVVESKYYNSYFDEIFITKLTESTSVSSIFRP